MPLRFAAILLLFCLCGCPWSCDHGWFTVPVIDPVTGCCVANRRLTTGQLTQLKLCTCSCDAGVCRRDQPQSLLEFPDIDPTGQGNVDFSACPDARITVDLACETRPP